MTKTEFIKVLSKRCKIKNVEAERIFNHTLEAISDVLAEEGELMFRDFGKFEIKDVKEKVARNPKTNEQFVLPASKKVKFTPGNGLKEKCCG